MEPSSRAKIIGPTSGPVTRAVMMVRRSRRFSRTSLRNTVRKALARFALAVTAFMLLIIAGFPGAFIHAFFSGALLIETIFSLDGLGLLSFESVINRDYPVVFATLYIFALLGLVVNLVSDFVYTLVDPRIDFESREV